MKAFQRGPTPALLSTHSKTVGQKYSARRALAQLGGKPIPRFNWPKRKGQSLYEIARAAAAHDTDAHCAYCDAFPIDGAGKKEIDHFQPKKLFPHLVIEWTNLFLSCSACNGQKKEKWDESLLRPDDSNYTFDRYFVFRPDTGELQPNPAASEEVKMRAEITIKVFGLNRPGARYLRRKSLTDSDVDRPYRFLAL